MNRPLLLVLAGALLCTSCVTFGKYDALEATHNQLKKEYNVARQELSEIRQENSELLRQNQSLSAEVKDLTDLKTTQTAELQRLRTELSNTKLGYDTVIENYMQRISGQSRDLDKMSNLLAARTQELNDREAAFVAKENALLAKQAQMQKEEEAAKASLAAKEKELEQVRSAVTKALVGFADKGLAVHTEDGKVYVSMESKLMFQSGSWTVSKEGQEAIKGLAKVLEENADLNIMVEGHTDNDAYKGSSAVKDNWDLSVMRATSIVKLLLKYGPNIDPARIEASGHGEFAPKVENNSAANKAQNRRTEIILSPKLNDILNILGRE
ncbi:MAG: OmpA family protein [Bacteroidales bacterium]|nr:OmpA family protein [Bacteroidales bacterium]